MSELKVIVLVICHWEGEYIELGKTIKGTWGKTETENVKIWYGWGNGYEGSDRNDFYLDTKEDTGAILRKTLAFFEFIKDEPFDYIFRVNAGSYVDTEQIVKHLEGKPRQKFYSGTPGKYWEIEFASGSGFFLSRDLVMLSIQKKDEFGDDHIDDVSYGRFMMKEGIPINATCIRVTWTGSGLIRQIGADIIPVKDFDMNNAYHWRLRSPDGDRKCDCDKMIELYNNKLNARSQQS